MQIFNPDANQDMVQGTLVHTVYRSEETGYAVMHVKVVEAEPVVEKTRVTVVGLFPALELQESYRFYGTHTEHPQYGEQFKAEQFERVLPTENDAIVHYLSSDRFPGIGKKTAQAVVDVFGSRTIQEILESPERLQEVPGLKAEKRELLVSQVAENQGMERVLLKLTQYGFGMNLAMKIYQVYAEETMATIEEDPYQLVWDIEGVGFHKADRLGEVLGIAKTSPERMKAGLQFVMHELCLQGGHVYVPEEMLIDRAYTLLTTGGVVLEREKIMDAVVELAEESRLVVDDGCAYLPSLYFAEKGFVTHLLRLMNAADEEVEEAAFHEALGGAEEAFHMTYAPQQKEAIRTAVQSPVMILTGGPGTGKTTVIQAIVRVIAELEGLPAAPEPGGETFPVLLAAPTGRAAKRMKETTGLPAQTVHKWLGYKGEMHEDENEGLERNESHPLEGRLLIVDEFSMVDMWLANQLLRAVPEGMKVIFVGDEDQLPSVGPGEVLGNLLTADVLPAVSLSTVYRQSEGSSIIDMAHAMKQGELPKDWMEPKDDRRFFSRAAEHIVEAVEQVCTNAKKRGYTAHEIQVLAPMYKGPAGIHALNERLQQLFNPPDEQRREVTFGEVVYRVGDVIMQLENDPESNVFNGDRGEIIAIFQAKEQADRRMKIVLAFDGNEVTYEKKDLRQITHAYCASIHKSQGSEFPIVVAPVVMSYRRMLERNLIYTGITRAKDFLILCGEKSAFEFAVQQDNRGSRNTRLVQLLKEAHNEEAKSAGYN
ncbi:ATP-dependent DNA helicase (RecD/TraA family) [Salsuginibacillus halophilus]|uniref:ATP-dependent RecD2 DNA helicase n=1 Tax=Salsuginibacillus halophilus TaxID=517424 RepID=A0A2P8HFW3_9BACI|nr:ATP-dependent RecD-like DNA helicase [Salsuginibacillus halophilus]PSL45093.1 ATP-dependent DNA helicase (RecD/TraA family) [Salsuginibacillus halophilus]